MNLNPIHRATSRPGRDPHPHVSHPAAQGHGKAELRSPLPALKPLSLNIFYQTQQRRLCMSNCRNIEVAILLPVPLYAPDPPDPGVLCQKSELAGIHAETANGTYVKELEFGGVESTNSEVEEESSKTLEEAKMSLTETSADQEQTRDRDTTTGILSHDNENTMTALPLASEEAELFRFFDLPLELRLKIYSYLLPPRTHTIVTQIPHNGFFYNTSSIPANSATSFYPFGRSPPSPAQLKYTTYKVLTTNFRSNFPVPSIHPGLLLVCKQIHAEAEPVLYGNKDAVWDFGVHIDALLAFWGDRSEIARRCVRNTRIAREVPAAVTSGVVETGQKKGRVLWDPVWEKACDFVATELTGLRSLDLTVWSSSGSATTFPSTNLNAHSLSTHSVEEDTTVMIAKQREQEQKWREWEYTAGLLGMSNLKTAKVTWWGFQSAKPGETGAGGGGFDNWIAGRMVGDRLVRDRMVRDGVVVEGVCVVGGVGA